MDEPRMKAGLARHQTAALAAVSTLGWLTAAIQPYQVAGLSNAYGVGPATGGFVISGEFLSLAISVMVASRGIERCDKRRLCCLGVALAIAASVVSTLHVGFVLLCVCRLAFGWGLGMIVAACNAIAGIHAQPERLFSFMWLANSFPFALTLYVEPDVERLLGPHGMFACQTGLLAALGPAALVLPRGRLSISPDVRNRARSPLSPRTIRHLFAISILFVGTNAMWSYIEQAGLHAGLEVQGIASVLSLSSLINAAGPAGAAWLGIRFGYYPPIMLGLIAMILDAVLVYAVPNVPAYVAGVLAYNMLTSFTVPYMQGLLAEADQTGRSAALGGAATNLGLAAGPVSGGLMSLLQSLPIIGAVSAGLFGFSLLLYAADFRQFQSCNLRRARTPAR
jgi:predicted MFS family arabinose efflux permease